MTRINDDGPAFYECNALIESADISFERGFILDCNLVLSFGGSGQSFGGWSLGGDPFQETTLSKHHEQSNLAAEFIGAVMAIAGVEKFSALKGKIIRVRKVDEWSKIIAIGHPIKDLWFDPKERFAGLLNKKNDALIAALAQGGE